jgi:hypothetical protein
MPSNPGTYNTKLYKGEEFAMDFRLLVNDVSIAFDSADKELLKGWVTGSKVITNLFKGQILQKIIEQSE